MQRSQIQTPLFRDLSVALVLSAGFWGRADAQEVLTVPFAGPLTGPIATYGLEVVHGAMLAQEDINGAGGLKSGPWQGYQINIKQFDDRAVPRKRPTSPSN